MRPTPRLGPAALLALSLGLAGTSCEAPRRLGLPTVVNVVARLHDGEYVSLLVDLRVPRERPGLRVSRGLVSYNGQQLLELEPSTRVTAGGGAICELRIADLLRAGTFSVQVSEARADQRLEVVHLENRSALLRLTDGSDVAALWEVGLYTGELHELAEAHATQRFERFGPQRGFAIYMADDSIMLSLPREDRSEDLRLLRGVDGVVSVNWIAEEGFPGSGLDVLERRFKMAGSVVASAQLSVPDGDLQEWSSDAALSVGSTANVSGGLVSWSGPRDASFALAARLTPDALCAAVRLRDDHILPGQDRVVIVTDLARYELAVPEAPVVIQQQGMTAAFTDQASFGVGLELCLEPTTWSPSGGHVPFRVLFHDMDPDQEVTTIASAPDVPWPALAGIRLPRRGRVGTLPPR